MDLYVRIKDSLEIVDLDFHKERNKKTFTECMLSDESPEELHFINDVPELDFCQELTLEPHKEKLTLPIKILLNDLGASDSSVNRFFGFSQEDIDGKYELFVKVWHDIFYKTLNKKSYMLPDEEEPVKYAAFFGEYGVDERTIIYGECHSPYFPMMLPESIVKKYYPNPTAYSKYLEGCQQYFDLTLLDKDDMAKYVLPLYYMDYVWKKAIADNPTRLDVYTKNWIQTLYGAMD